MEVLKLIHPWHLGLESLSREVTWFCLICADILELFSGVPEKCSLRIFMISGEPCIECSRSRRGWNLMAVHGLETALCPLRPHTTSKHLHRAGRPSTHAQLIHKGKVVITTCARIFQGSVFPVQMVPGCQKTRHRHSMPILLSSYLPLLSSSRCCRNGADRWPNGFLKSWKSFLGGNPCPLRTKQLNCLGVFWRERKVPCEVFHSHCDHWRRGRVSGLGEFIFSHLKGHLQGL